MKMLDELCPDMPDLDGADIFPHLPISGLPDNTDSSQQTTWRTWATIDDFDSDVNLELERIRKRLRALYRDDDVPDYATALFDDEGDDQ